MQEMESSVENNQGRGNETKIYTKGEYNEAHEKGKDIDLEKKLN